MKKIILLSTVLFVLIIGCSSAPEMVQDQKLVTYLSNGIWLGSLPCADCEGIDYQLTLKMILPTNKNLFIKVKARNNLLMKATGFCIRFCYRT